MVLKRERPAFANTTMNCRYLATGALLLLLILTGCLAPIPRSPETPPDMLLRGHDEWSEADLPRTTTVNYPDGQVRVYQTNAWHRWNWLGWTAVDRDLDGVVDLVFRQVREADWMWASVTEYYRDSSLDWTLDLHYYMLEDGFRHRTRNVNLPAPKLGAPTQEGEPAHSRN